MQVNLYSISRTTPNAGVLFSTSSAALAFAFILLLIVSYAAAAAAAGDEVPPVTSPMTRTQDGAARAAVEVRMEGLSRSTARSSRWTGST